MVHKICALNELRFRFLLWLLDGEKWREGGGRGWAGIIS